MKSSTVVLLVLLVLGVVLFLLKRRKEVSGPKFRSTDEFIQFMAAEAVKDAEEKGINLDYRVDSVKKVEEILGRLHEQYLRDPSSVGAKGLGSAYGAYIGEVIRRARNGNVMIPLAGRSHIRLFGGQGTDIHTQWRDVTTVS